VNAWAAAALSFIGALLVALLIAGLRALWSLATELAGLRKDTTANTVAIKELTRRVDRVDRGDRRRSRGGPRPAPETRLRYRKLSPA
jgi:hypothetical protein